MTDTIVIGAGQAGLAAAYYLQSRGVDYRVLEALPRVGDQWRRRWDGLRLFTPNRYNKLPGSDGPPGQPYGLPSALEVADYLEGYAREHGLRVTTGAEVACLTKPAGAFALTLRDGRRLKSRRVIVAGGAYRTARVPGFAARLAPTLAQVHTSALRSPAAWVEEHHLRHVLVVGAGASGHQVAKLLAPHTRVTLAGEDPGHLPRRVLGRDVYDFLYGLGVLPTRVDSLAGKVLAKAPTKGEIRVGERVDASARRHGIARCAKVADVSPQGLVHCVDGQRVTDVDGFVWATGYDNRYPFVEVAGALGADGKPLHTRGHSPVPGLYWMGLHLMRRVNSSLLGGVGRDACELIAEMR